MSPLLDNETNINMMKDYGYYFIPSLCSLLGSVMDVFNDNNNIDYHHHTMQPALLHCVVERFKNIDNDEVLIIIIILCSLLHYVVVERFKNIDNDDDGVLIIIMILCSLLHCTVWWWQTPIL